MSLPPVSDHTISLQDAGKLTANYRRQAGIGASKGGMFWKDIVLNILTQPGCVGMRYYYGREDNGKPVLVLVGVDKDGKDMTKGILAERAWLCPPFCDDFNDLNSSIQTRHHVHMQQLVPSDTDRSSAVREEVPVSAPAEIALEVQ